MQAQAKLLPQNRPSCPKDVNAAIKLPTTRRGADADGAQHGSRTAFSVLKSVSFIRSEAHPAMRARCCHEARHVLAGAAASARRHATGPAAQRQRAQTLVVIRSCCSPSRAPLRRGGDVGGEGCQLAETRCCMCTAGKTTTRCRTSSWQTLYVLPPIYVKKSFTARLLQIAERGGGGRNLLLRHLRIVDVYEGIHRCRGDICALCPEAGNSCAETAPDTVVYCSTSWNSWTSENDGRASD